MASVKRNIGYQTICFLLSSILSLMIAPYISRILGAENLGIFSYTASIVAYFEILATLGISNYGMRSIAEAGKNREERSKTFLGIFYLQLIGAGLSIALYLGYIMFYCKDNQFIALLQGLSIFSCLIDINWLYTGMEKFKLIAIQGMIVRVISVLATFIFVKSPNDLWLYVVLMIAQVLIENILRWFWLSKYVSFQSCSLKEITRHIRPNLVLMVPRAAMLIYGLMDKTMLGALSTYGETGYYYNTDKIVSLLLRGIFVVNGVISPRMSSLLSRQKREEADALFKDSYNITAFLFVGATFGISAISAEFTPLFFGEGYEECIVLIIMLSPIIFLKACGSVIRQQFMIPHKMDSLYAKSITLGMTINLLVNFYTIPRYGAKGAVFATIAAELAVYIVQIIAIRKKIAILKLVKESWIYFFAGALMFYGVRSLADMLQGKVLILLIEILVGGFIYLSVVFLHSYFLGEKKLILFLKNLKGN